MKHVTLISVGNELQCVQCFKDDLKLVEIAQAHS